MTLMHCLLCATEMLAKSFQLCHSCWAKIEFLSYSKNDKISAVAKYNRVLKKLMHIFKYKSPWMLCALFANWMSLLCKDLIEEADIILPVPMHKYKLMFRSYNQSAVVSKKLAVMCKKVFVVNGLIRTRNVGSQSLLDRKSRLINVRDAFAANKAKTTLLRNKNILLIDDVVTTGATLSECIKVLEQIEPRSIRCLCIAKTY